MTSVVIPDSVTGIGESAFKGCSGLTSIYVNRKKPLSVDSDIFLSVDKTVCTLYVPKGTLTAYKAAYIRKEFGNIVEMK